MNQHESADATRPSLLIRIKDSDDVEAWREFYELYSPLLYSFARQRGLSHDEAEDIRSSCYETIVRHIKQFNYAEEKTGFRAWLRTMVLRRVIDFQRKKRPQELSWQRLDGIPVDQSSAEDDWEKAWRLHHLKYCVALVGKRVQPTSFEVFRLLTDDELTVSQVCDRMGMNPAQVHKIKSRCLDMVRQEMRRFDQGELS